MGRHQKRRSELQLILMFAFVILWLSAHNINDAANSGVMENSRLVIQLKSTVSGHYRYLDPDTSYTQAFNTPDQIIKIFSVNPARIIINADNPNISVGSLFNFKDILVNAGFNNIHIILRRSAFSIALFSLLPFHTLIVFLIKFWRKFINIIK